MKAIATVNFKGGVGKTTVTWLLAKYAAEKRNKRVLVVDTDAQMSMTMAVEIQDDGTLGKDFNAWYENAQKKGKTLLAALDKYDRYAKGLDKVFDFPVDRQFIYQQHPNLDFIPSVVELYWLELEVFDKAAVKDFIKTLLGKIEHSQSLPQYQYVFFDCPPNFTALSHSVMSCCSALLIPVNPDVFAPRGIDLLLGGLRDRIQPWPNPKIGVFMNKANIRAGVVTRETSRYWELAKVECQKKAATGMDVKALESPIIDRVSIKRAIPEKYFPSEFEPYFARLWDNVEKL